MAGRLFRPLMCVLLRFIGSYANVDVVIGLLVLDSSSSTGYSDRRYYLRIPSCQNVLMMSVANMIEAEI